MSTLELERFESVAAGNGQVLFRLAGRWPQPGDLDGSPATLLVESAGGTCELDALPEPGLNGDGAARNAAFAAPESLRSEATSFALAVGELLFELPGCDERDPGAPDAGADGSANVDQGGTAPRVSLGERLAAMRGRLPAPRLPRLPAPPNLAAALPRPRLERWDREELTVMVSGCALGTAVATAILVQLVP